MSCQNQSETVHNSQQVAATVIDNRGDHFLTVKELAQTLRISEHTIRDWVYKRQIPVCRVLGRVRFRWSEIEKWLQERSHVG